MEIFGYSLSPEDLKLAIGAAGTFLGCTVAGFLNELRKKHDRVRPVMDRSERGFREAIMDLYHTCEWEKTVQATQIERLERQIEELKWKVENGRSNRSH